MLTYSWKKATQPRFSVLGTHPLSQFPQATLEITTIRNPWSEASEAGDNILFTAQENQVNFGRF